MLEAHDATFGYPGKEPVLHGFSLAVEPGERVAVSAPSGGGKTTLCRLLAGYGQPQAGQVLADGAPLPRRGPCPVQMIGQHPELMLDPRMTMGASLAEAVGGKAAPGTAADAALDELRCRFGIRQEWLSRYPRELSGGELQRFCIVRALAAKPRYLVADEATTMLDALTQAQLWHEMLAEAEQRDLGIVLTTHSPALAARIATRVVELP